MARKNPETVVVSGFSEPISFSVRNVGCGGRTWTSDLRVMSPTSYQLLYSAIYSLPDGAGDRTRTGTVLLPGDFKSPVSTIPPHRRILARIRIPHSCGIVNTLAQYFCPSTKLGPLRPSPSVSKSLAEFAARRRQKIQIIFHRDMCVGENIPQTARDCKCGIFARRRLQSFCRKNPKDFSAA